MLYIFFKWQVMSQDPHFWSIIIFQVTLIHENAQDR